MREGQSVEKQASHGATKYDSIAPSPCQNAASVYSTRHHSKAPSNCRSMVPLPFVQEIAQTELFVPASPSRTQCTTLQLNATKEMCKNIDYD